MTEICIQARNVRSFAKNTFGSILIGALRVLTSDGPVDNFSGFFEPNSLENKPPTPLLGLDWSARFDLVVFSTQQQESTQDVRRQNRVDSPEILGRRNLVYEEMYYERYRVRNVPWHQSHEVQIHQRSRHGEFLPPLDHHLHLAQILWYHLDDCLPLESSNCPHA